MPTLLPDVSVKFFAAGTQLLRTLEFDRAIWRSPSEPLREKFAYTSGGNEDIDPSRYDVFVLVGIGFCLDIPEIGEGYDLASMTREPEGVLLSRACFAAVVEAWFERNIAMQMIDKMKAVSEKPILLCAAPFPSELELTDRKPLRNPDRFQDADFLNDVVAMAKMAGAKLSARHGFTLIWQDEDTVAIPGFTKAAYGLDAARNKPRGDTSQIVDRRHGNEDYGSLMLGAILQRLHEMSGNRVLMAEPERRRTAPAETTPPPASKACATAGRR